MTDTKKTSNGAYYARLAVTLFLITAIVAALLGAVNAVTADKIAEIKEEKTAAALQEVLPSSGYDEIAYNGTQSLVSTVYAAADGGYVVEVLPSGFGGEIDMVVGVDETGVVTGVSIIDMSETSGLGANASREDFRSQFAGESGTVTVTKDGGTIDALTGATVTSRAVCRGVSAAVAAVAELG
jgi:electron transport complex protein RnfG